MSDISTHISVVGEAVYPHLTKPDVRFNEAGEYKVTLKVAKSDASAMLKVFDKALDDSLAMAQKEHKGKGIKTAPIPYTIEGDNVFFKFKMKASGVNKKTKEQFTQRPMLFDAKKNPLPSSISIWGGSKIKVAFQLRPYFTQLLGAGIVSQLKAVQVISLVEGRQLNLFNEEDGFEVTAQEKENEQATEVQASSDF